jgi:hypothetical protein
VAGLQRPDPLALRLQWVGSTNSPTQIAVVRLTSAGLGAGDVDWTSMSGHRARATGAESMTATCQTP